MLSAQPGKIALIREGLFLRCYQQSLFSLLRLEQEVKVLGRQFKNLEGGSGCFMLGSLHPK